MDCGKGIKDDEVQGRIPISLTTAKNDIMGPVDRGLPEGIKPNKIECGYVRTKGFERPIRREERSWKSGEKKSRALTITPKKLWDIDEETSGTSVKISPGYRRSDDPEKSTPLGVLRRSI